MARIGLITLNPKIYNYGGILQEYALLCKLQEYGDAEIVNFNVNNELTIFSLKRDIRNLEARKIIDFIKDRFSHPRIVGNYREIVEKRRTMFDNFRNQYMKISYPVLNQELNDDRYDILIAGSDQIWNPDYSIPAFFLDFKTNSKKIIYAASLGKAHLTNRQRVIYGKYINKLKYVSLRERSGIELLQKYTDTPLKCVVDPTLLITREQWDEICPEREIQGKYIFCYFLELTEEKYIATLEFAEKHNLRIANIPFLHGIDDRVHFENSIIPKNLGPDGFISLIKNAEYVITDSFHAAVFSCIYKKNFKVFGRNCGSYNMNTRLENLMEIFGVKNNIITPNELYEPFITKYGDERIFLKMKDESIKFLNNSIFERK